MNWPEKTYFGWASTPAHRDREVGPLVIESFTADNASIATAASIWRPLATSQDDLARDGLDFLRSLTAPAPLTAGARP